MKKLLYGIRVGDNVDGKKTYKGPVAFTPFAVLIPGCFTFLINSRESVPSLCEKMAILSPPRPWLTAKIWS
jgi:hypothetical protein